MTSLSLRKLLSLMELLSLVFLAQTNTAQAQNFGFWNQPGFPGTPQWNQYWNNFQGQMQNMGNHIAQSAAANANTYNNGQSSFSNFVSGSGSSFSGGGGMSVVRVNGFEIRTNGLSVSTTTQNGQLEIRLAHPVDEVVRSAVTTGHEIEIRIGKTGGQQEHWAKIHLPNSINPKEVKIEQLQRVVVIRCPTQGVSLAFHG